MMQTFMVMSLFAHPKYNINTPTAHGNTETGVMNVVGKSVIRTNRGEVVHTNDGTYNSKRDFSF